MSDDYGAMPGMGMDPMRQPCSWGQGAHDDGPGTDDGAGAANGGTDVLVESFETEFFLI